MSSFYTPPPTVIDGDVAFAKDVNDINSETDSGFNAVEAALGGLEISVQQWAELAEKWAQEAEDTPVEPDLFSAFHWSSKSSASAEAALTSQNAAASSASSALSSKTATDANVVLTNADVVSTSADVVLTGLDVDTTNADVVSTNADVVSTNADVVSTGLDATDTAADRVQTGLDLVATNQDTIDTAADLVATNQDTIDTAADLVATNQDTIDTAADRVQTGLDATASGISETNAATSAAEAAASAASIDPDLLVHQDALDGAAIIPPGTTAQRPSSPVGGMLRYSTDLDILEDYSNGAWRIVYSSNSILGTVSQSAGVPTGAIIEAGSNGNGEYTRYADGTQICTLVSGIITVNAASGSVFQSPNTVLTYPAVFSDAPTLGTNAVAPTVVNSWSDAIARDSTTCTVIILAGANTATAKCTVLAIGRWF